MSFRTALSGETDAGRPDPGQYEAVLDEAKLLELNGGAWKIVTNWKTTGRPLYAWDSWFNFAGGQSHTRELLDELGIRYAQIMRDNPDDEDAKDALNDELLTRAGSVYTVVVSHWGDNGVNTKVLSATAQRQLQDLPVDPVTVPADTRGADPDDDDIPF